jgi:hypothetical protein
VILVNQRVRQPEHVPDVGVLGDDPERLPFAATADHDRQVPLDRRRLQPKVIECIASGGRARHLATVQEDAGGRDGLGQPVETLAEASPEVEPERPMLWLEPGAAQAHHRPAPADVVDGRHRFHGEPGVAECVGPDEQSEADPLGRLGNGCQRRVALEDRLIGGAEDRQQVIPRPYMVVAESLGGLGGGEERWPVGGLAPQCDPELQVGHRSPQEMMKSYVCTRLLSW